MAMMAMQQQRSDKPPLESSEVCSFRDSGARKWRVFEREKWDPNNGQVTFLVFESESSFRCVKTYPGNWRELPPEDLERLSWKT